MNRLWVGNSARDREIWEKLLVQEGIKTEQSIEVTYGIFEEDRLIATGSRFHNVLKCIAVDSRYKGGSVFNELISFLIDDVFSHGYSSVYVYTKESARSSFGHLGFTLLEHVDDKLYFMEKSLSGFQSFLQDLGHYRREGTSVAAIVMNANPFTKGHQYLVEKTSRENDIVHLFVLAEDMSAFPASVRMDLVKAGTAHLKNVLVHGTGDYMVSSMTFPSYFLKEGDDVTEIHARLDARLFKNHIAPVLGITRRYVGNEPYSRATNIYNEALLREFGTDIELVILDRISVDDDIISATKVRRMLVEDDMETVRKYVPETTYAFFSTEAGRAVIAKLKAQV